MGVESAKGCPGREGTPGAGSPSPPAGPPSPAAAVTVRVWVFLELPWTAVTISAHGVHGIVGGGGGAGGEWHKFPFLLCFGVGNAL